LQRYLGVVSKRIKASRPTWEKNMDMDSWITGSLDTATYGLLLIALHRLDLASFETM
jgi:hypothetical protein